MIVDPLTLEVARTRFAAGEPNLVWGSGVRVGEETIPYVVIALQSLSKGVGKLEVDRETIARDVDEAWEVLAEAVQTVMRRYGIPEPYEQLKALTRGQAVSHALLHEFVAGLEIPDHEKQRLLALTPASYTGLAADLAGDI